jgi:endoglucanase
MNKYTPPGRRQFLKKTALLTGTLGLAGSSAIDLAGKALRNGADWPGGSCFPAPGQKNPLPGWKGFNLLDFFSPDPEPGRQGTTKEDLQWMSDWGFDFVRIPMAYPSYLDFDRSRDISPDQVYSISDEAVERVEQLVQMAHDHHMHVSLNLHRAPGYCVNAGFHEPYDLWKDREAQVAFCWHWKMWAGRFRNISREKISFDLLNEPSMREDMNDQHSRRTAVPGELYAKVAEEAAGAIWSENPDHLVIADGNDVGTRVIPELTHLPIAQSCRGYYPGIISHYKAPWAMKDIENLPSLKYPGQVGDEYLSRDMLEAFYEPWIALVQSGVGVHCGECGCYNKTPHDIFLAWFGDVLDILGSNGIGFALWNFRGSFGILDSERRDVDYEDWYGHKLDRRLLELLLKN